LKRTTALFTAKKIGVAVSKPASGASPLIKKDESKSEERKPADDDATGDEGDVPRKASTTLS